MLLSGLAGAVALVLDTLDLQLVRVHVVFVFVFLLVPLTLGRRGEHLRGRQQSVYFVQ